MSFRRVFPVARLKTVPEALLGLIGLLSTVGSLRSMLELPVAERETPASRSRVQTQLSQYATRAAR
jgi:hypothetical protein